MRYTVLVNGEQKLDTDDRPAAEAEIDRHLPTKPGPAKADIRLQIRK